MVQVEFYGNKERVRVRLMYSFLKFFIFKSLNQGLPVLELGCYQSIEKVLVLPTLLPAMLLILPSSPVAIAVTAISYRNCIS